MHPPRVGIVGTGTIGTMAAWQLAGRGAEVLAFDRFAPGHDRGAAGGESRIFRTAYMEGARYIPLLQRAEELWRSLEGETGQAVLDLCGGLSIGPPDHPAMRELLTGARDHGLEHQVLTSEESASRFPQHPLHPGDIGVLETHAGVIRPDAALRAAGSRAEELGAHLQRYTTVTAIERGASGWTVRTDTGHHEVDVDTIVLAPGPWGTAARTPAREVLDTIGMEARQLTMCWFPAREPGELLPDRNPVVIRVGETGYSCFPVMDHTSVKVSVHSAPRPTVRSPEELPRSATPEFLALARETVGTHLPRLITDPSRTATYADVFTPDGHGVLGPVPGHPGLVVATGFSGHGFKLSPLFGEVIADLALEGRTRHDIEHLDPRRFQPAGE